MYIPEEMQKVNKFIDVAIPSNRSYFSRLGEVTQPSTQYTGEELAKLNQDKISQIVDYAEYAAAKAEDEYNKSEKP